MQTLCAEAVFGTSQRNEHEQGLQLLEKRLERSGARVVSRAAKVADPRDSVQEAHPCELRVRRSVPAPSHDVLDLQHRRGAEAREIAFQLGFDVRDSCLASFLVYGNAVIFYRDYRAKLARQQFSEVLDRSHWASCASRFGCVSTDDASTAARAPHDPGTLQERAARSGEARALRGRSADVCHP